MAPPHTTLLLSHLPTEILTQILEQGFITSEFEFPYLWCTLRNVCHRFRQIVEALTARNYLRKTYLVYTFPNPDVSMREDYPKVKFWLSFKECVLGGSLGGDDDIAVFTPDAVINATPRDPVWLELLEGQIRDEQQDGFVRPAHLISVVRYVNDTHLEGFEVCITHRESALWEVRIYWKESISRLILEERLRQDLSRRWIREQRARSSGLSEKPLHDLYHAMKLHLLSHRMTRDESFQLARKKRIAAQYKSIGVNFHQDVQGNRDLALAMRHKGEEIEGHQSFMNQFSFE